MPYAFIRGRLLYARASMVKLPHRVPASRPSLNTIQGYPIHNEILLGLPRNERKIVFPRLVPVELQLRAVIQPAGEPIKAFYFIDSGIASILSVMERMVRGWRSA